MALHGVGPVLYGQCRVPHKAPKPVDDVLLLVRQAVRDVFAAFGKRGLIIGPCPSAHSIMPWQNTLAMVDEWKKLR